MFYDAMVVVAFPISLTLCVQRERLVTDGLGFRDRSSITGKGVAPKQGVQVGRRRATSFEVVITQ